MKLNINFDGTLGYPCGEIINWLVNVAKNFTTVLKHSMIFKFCTNSVKCWQTDVSASFGFENKICRADILD